MFSFNYTKILESVFCEYRSDVVDRWGYIGDWGCVIRLIWDAWAGRLGSRTVSIVLIPIIVLLFGIWVRSIESIGSFGC